MKKYEGIELIRALSDAFGPSGCEDGVRELIRAQVEDTCDGLTVDRAGNLLVRVKGRGMDYDQDDPARILLCAHMDEVGFMVKELTDEGYLKFSVIGGIDPRVLCGKHLRVGDEKQTIKGVIATKAIHMQSAEERTKMTPANKMYIDVGAKNAEDAGKLTAVGDFAVFDTAFSTFGKDGKYMKGKALDGRCGAAALIEVIRDVYASSAPLPFDVWFAFTRCGEIGIKGAAVAAYTVHPSLAVVVGGTPANDLPDTPAAAVTARLGQGSVLSLCDRDTLYDAALTRRAQAAAEAAGLKTQIKQGASGTGDAGVVQRTAEGVRVMALSLPVRNAGTAASVALYEDYESVRELLRVMLREWKV